jgi:GH18 family chitinase
LRYDSWNYRDLPRRGSVIVEDFDKGASWSMDFNRREFISFDTDRIVAKKARYIMDNDLAGGMYWELSGDKVGGESLIGVAARIFGKLDTTPVSILASMDAQMSQTLFAEPPEFPGQQISEHRQWNARESASCGRYQSAAAAAKRLRRSGCMEI